MAPKIKPLGKRILVKRSQSEETKGGILLPESAKEKPKRGEVVSVGPGSLGEDGKLQPLNLAVGDTVLFGAYAGVEVEDGDYLIMTEDDVLAVVEGGSHV